MHWRLIYKSKFLYFFLFVLEICDEENSWDAFFDLSGDGDEPDQQADGPVCPEPPRPAERQRNRFRYRKTKQLTHFWF